MWHEAFCLNFLYIHILCISLPICPMVIFQFLVFAVAGEKTNLQKEQQDLWCSAFKRALQTKTPQPVTLHEMRPACGLCTSRMFNFFWSAIQNQKKKNKTAAVALAARSCLAEAAPKRAAFWLKASGSVLLALMRAGLLSLIGRVVCTDRDARLKILLEGDFSKAPVCILCHSHASSIQKVILASSTDIWEMTRRCLKPCGGGSGTLHWALLQEKRLRSGDRHSNPSPRIWTLPRLLR